jgi:hypothetical protein
MATRSNLLSLLGRFWFPLTLLVLLLLAVAGMVILILNHYGMQGSINSWLQENFALTQHPPLAWGVFLLLLLVPFAIVLLYFLKLKRRPLQVPSTFLWRKSIEDLHVNALFQWLRRNILLLLQVLTVLVLIFAVMGFRLHGASSSGKRYILLIDNSASMSATDVKPSRLHAAKEEALKIIADAGDNDYGMVIAFNSKAVTLQSFTNNKAKLMSAVKGIEQTQRPTRIEEAINLADSLANQSRSTEDLATRPEQEEPGKERTFVPPQGTPTELHLFSDGRFPNLSETALTGLHSRQAGNESALGNLNLHYHAIGNVDARNVGLVNLDLRRPGAESGKVADPDALKLEVFARVNNYCREEVQAELRLDMWVDGKFIPVTTKQLTLAKRLPDKDEPGEKTVTVPLPAVPVHSNTVLRAYLEKVRLGSGDKFTPLEKDDFPLDDEAWVVLGALRKARVLIISSGNKVLSAFFDSDAAVQKAAVERLTPDALATDEYRKKARSGDYDLVIFDRCSPKDVEDLPYAHTFFIDQPPPPWKRGKADVQYPYLMLGARDHVLLRHIPNLWDVGVSEAWKFNLKDKGVPPHIPRLIETTGDTALLFTLPRGPYTDLVMTFPLLDDSGALATNWPLRPSFPLFMRNVLYVLGNVRDALRETTVQPGETMVLRPEPGVKTMEVIDPLKKKHKLQRGTRPDFIFGDTEQVGVYQVRRDDGIERSFAVNLLDAQESNIIPQARVKIGPDEKEAGKDQDRPWHQPRELWKWIVLAALVLLLLEWYIYNRRIYV